MIKIICFGSMIISCMHLFTLNSGIGFLEAFTMLLMGITVIPILSATYTFACELTFPVPEGQTVGMIITFGNLLGTGVGILASYLLEFDTRYPMIFFIALCLLALIISFFIEEDLRRLNMDDVKNSEYIEESELRKQSFDERDTILPNEATQNQKAF